MSFLKTYYDTEGPFGLPMRDRQARALDALVRTLPPGPPYEPRQAVLEKGPAELLPGERADVSWISEESIDRQGDIVLSAGMDDAHFKLNPLVTMQHAYWMPPVGRSLWRRRAADGALRGIKAKTQYPVRPGDWPAGADWPPDVAFTLVQAGLLRGKSIGFLPVKARRPTEDEIARDPALARAGFIIEKWVLLEYACVYLPAQQNAVVESVSKGLAIPPEFARLMGLETQLGARNAERGTADSAPHSELRAPSSPVPFTPLAEVERRIHRELARIDPRALVERAVKSAWEKVRGRV